MFRLLRRITNYILSFQENSNTLEPNQKTHQETLAIENPVNPNSKAPEPNLNIHKKPVKPKPTVVQHDLSILSVSKYLISGLCLLGLNSLYQTFTTSPKNPQSEDTTSIALKGAGLVLTLTASAKTCIILSLHLYNQYFQNSNPQLNKASINHQYNRILRVTGALQYSFNTISTLGMAFDGAHQFRRGFKQIIALPAELSWDYTAYLLDVITRALPFFSGLLGIYYNFYQFRSAYQDELEASDSPFFGLINASAQLSLSQAIMMLPNIMITSSSYTKILLNTLNEIFHFNYYQQFIQMLKNSWHYHRDCMIEIEEIILKNPPIEPPQKTIKPKKTMVRSSETYVPPCLFTKTNRHVPEETRNPKLKTRGISNAIGPSSSSSCSSSSSSSSSSSFSLPNTKENTIKEILDWVQEARLRRSISTAKIELYLNRLKNLLPNGTLKNRKGSLHTLTWTWEGKRLSINYETPHGIDSNQFTGRKLKWMLNLLEAASLCLLTEEERNAHLKRTLALKVLELVLFMVAEKPCSSQPKLR